MTIKNIAFGLLAATLITLPSTAVPGAHMGNYVATNLADVEFAPFGDGPLEIGILWGDPATGPSGFLLRIPPGFELPMHSHTASYRAVVLHGQHLHWLGTEDKANVQPTSAGGYYLQPATQLHGDTNPAGVESLILVMFDGAFDFILPE